MTREINTVRELPTQSTVVEKPAIVNETEKRQIIEEIQPVIYKETVVPTLIRETKPVYQKIVEGTTYTHQTLPPMPLSGSHYASFQNPIMQPQLVREPMMQPLVQQPILANAPLIEKDVFQTTTTGSSVPFQPSIPFSTTGNVKPGLVEEKKVITTTTTTNSPYTPI